MHNYRADIDGLRALAVIMVLVFHFDLGLSGGFIGVDIFFVISGYLITHLILKALEENRFSVRDFWMRRIRRLFPALGFMVFFNVIFAALALYPVVFRDYGKELIAQATMISNIYFAQQDGYFAAPSENLPFLHTWSLAVEEQFYLFFPFLLAWMWHKKPSRIRFIICIILYTSFGFNMFGANYFTLTNFFILPGRIWELLLGALVALPTKKSFEKHKGSSAAGWAAVVTILACASFFSKNTLFPGVAALPVCVSTALLITINAQHETSKLKEALSFRPLVYIGKISYSLYLWHWPIYVFAHYIAINEVRYSENLALMCASFFIAIFSYHYIEQPIRKGAISNRNLAASFLIFTTFTIICGLFIYKLDGLNSRFSSQILRLANEANHRIKSEDTIIPKNSENAPLLPIMVWGDSHAAHLRPMLEDLCRDLNARIHLRSESAAPPLLEVNVPRHPNLVDRNNTILNEIQELGINHLILVARWEAYYGKIHRLKLIGELSHDAEKSFRRSFEATIRKLTDLGVQVSILRQVPQQKIHPPTKLANSLRFRNNLNVKGISKTDAYEQFEIANAVIDQVSKPKQVDTLDPFPLFYPNTEHSILTLNGFGIYHDEDHVSPTGARLMKDLVKPILQDCLKDY